MSDQPYAAHELLVAPARRHPELWRLLAGLMLTAALTVAMGIGLRGALALVAPHLTAGGVESPLNTGTTPTAMLVLLYSFGVAILAVMVAARLAHNRHPGELIGPLARAARQFWAVFRILIVLNAGLLLLPPYDMGLDLVANLDFATWALLLPLSLGALLVQTASEEILFRGYFQQSLAARFSSPLVWMAIPALVFGLLHYDPVAAGDNAWLVTLWAVAFGLMTADLTARAGTLGPAIALHMVNNIAAILIVSVPDKLDGLALANTPYALSDSEGMRTWLMIDFAFMAVGWLAARLAIRR